MRKIVTSIAAISLLVACGEKTAEGKVDYAVLSGKVSSVDAKPFVELEIVISTISWKIVSYRHLFT